MIDLHSRNFKPLRQDDGVGEEKVSSKLSWKPFKSVDEEPSSSKFKSGGIKELLEEMRWITH